MTYILQLLYLQTIKKDKYLLDRKRSNKKVLISDKKI